jgi:integral membrane protein
MPGEKRVSPTGFRRTVSRAAPGYARPGDLEEPLKGLGAALSRYRVLAYIVGTGLATLCFVGIPLQYAAGIPQVDSIVGPIHGIFYMVYLVTAVDLARRARFTLLQMAAMVGAGFVPLLAFVVEHRVTTRLRASFPEIDARRASDATSPSG